MDSKVILVEFLFIKKMIKNDAAIAIGAIYFVIFLSDITLGLEFILSITLSSKELK